MHNYENNYSFSFGAFFFPGICLLRFGMILEGIGMLIGPYVVLMILNPILQAIGPQLVMPIVWMYVIGLLVLRIYIGNNIRRWSHK